MIALESIREKLGVGGAFTESRGTHWLNAEALGVRKLAQVMNDFVCRFVTITAYQLPGAEGFRLEYHWDLEGRLLGFPFQIAGNSIESIADLSEAADWIEREVHEEYAIDFTGREYQPLLLRKDNAIGVNLRETGAPAKPAAGVVRQDEVAK